MVQNTYLGKMDARDQPSQKTNANMIMNKVIVNTQDLRLSYRLASLRLQALNKADSFQVPSFLKNTYYRENLPNVSRCISARDSWFQAVFENIESLHKGSSRDSWYYLQIRF